ncbi:MAG: hypothetical protein ACRDYZ_07030 [Acidimicrobiales bacterium]
MASTTITVTEIHCASCESTIRRAARRPLGLGVVDDGTGEGETM